ncbi:unnamed protein product [Clonostachys rhizophaga]|uniref:Uncharacterized protein n=1 Tax=Clonostachys rhizophaga TaxID=160324 RepID=A0A9N9VSG9_9HYPO|nr:unnamed protein product [Clonostachys rhizophaga]
MDGDENSAVQGDIEFHQVVKDQLNAIKIDITRLENELSEHDKRAVGTEQTSCRYMINELSVHDKRAVGIWRADIQTDVQFTRKEQADSATDLHDLLSKITERSLSSRNPPLMLAMAEETARLILVFNHRTALTVYWIMAMENL